MKQLKKKNTRPRPAKSTKSQYGVIDGEKQRIPVIEPELPPVERPLPIDLKDLKADASVERRRRQGRKRKRRKPFSVDTILEHPIHSFNQVSYMVSMTFPAKSQKDRPEEATIEMLKKSAKLEAQGKPNWPVSLEFWPNHTKKDAQQYQRTLISKHRNIYDDFLEDYKNSNLPH